MDKTKIIGTLCILGTTFCYGLVPSLSFLSFEQGVATETLLFDKFLYATVAIWTYILIKKIDVKLSRSAGGIMVVVALAYVGIATTLYFSFNYISGSLATIISFTFPVMVLIIEMIRGTEKVRATGIIAVLISMGGMLLIVYGPGIKPNTMGILFALGTAVCYTIYILGLASKPLKESNSVVVAGYVLLASAIFNFFRCLISGEPFFAMRMTQLALMLTLALVCAFAAILLNCIGVKLIGSVRSSIINTFEPVVACVFGYLLIGDDITRNMIIGAILIMAAVLITNMPSSSTSVNNTHAVDDDPQNAP